MANRLSSCTGAEEGTPLAIVRRSLRPPPAAAIHAGVLCKREEEPVPLRAPLWGKRFVALPSNPSYCNGCNRGKWLAIGRTIAMRLTRQPRGRSMAAVNATQTTCPWQDLPSNPVAKDGWLREILQDELVTSFPHRHNRLVAVRPRCIAHSVDVDSR